LDNKILGEAERIVDFRSSPIEPTLASFSFKGGKRHGWTRPACIRTPPILAPGPDLAYPPCGTYRSRRTPPPGSRENHWPCHAPLMPTKSTPTVALTLAFPLDGSPPAPRGSFSSSDVIGTSFRWHGAALQVVANTLHRLFNCRRRRHRRGVSSWLTTVLGPPPALSSQWK